MTSNHTHRHRPEVVRPGDGILAEHDRRAALTAHQQKAGEMHSVGRTHGTSETWDWRSRAACASTDPEAFFPTAPAGVELERAEAAAKRICAGCRVQSECREWALEALPFGVAGGLSESERAERRRSSTRPRRPGRTPVRSTIASRRSGQANAAPSRAEGVAALAAGGDRTRIALECGVSRRTVDRWAADLHIARQQPGGGV